MSIYQPQLETLSRDDLHDLQLERLRETVNRVRENNARYAELVGGPDEVRSQEDLSQFGFLTKADLRDAYPYDLTCAPNEDFARIQISSGTTGTPVLNAYTHSDTEQWAEVMARCLVAAGVTPEDVIQITPSFGLFNGGFGFHHGAVELGCMIVPSGAGRTQMQLRLMRELGSSVVGAIASYPLRIMEVAEQEGFDFNRDSQLRIGIFGAETWSDELRIKIEEGMGIRSHDIIGMTETGGVGMGIDCEARDGIHVWEDHYLIEILDPQTQQPVPDGERGELVVTTLTRKGLPLIRFRTGDLTAIYSREKCACGRTCARVDRITGRLDDMVKVKGVNFYPRQVESLLLGADGTATDYQIVIDRVEGKDDCRIVLEVEDRAKGDQLAEDLSTAIYESLGFHAQVEPVPVGTIERPPGKAVRLVDKRTS